MHWAGSEATDPRPDVAEHRTHRGYSQDLAGPPGEAAQDRSTGQINAPAAWKPEMTAKLPRSRVLDTGADQNHPDLAGWITQARDF